MIRKMRREFKVLKEFLYKDPDTNYMRVAKVGEVLELPREAIIDLLATGRIEPHDWPDEIECEVLIGTCIKAPDKLITIEPGEIVSIERSQAVELIVNRRVKPCDKRFDLMQYNVTQYNVTEPLNLTRKDQGQGWIRRTFKFGSL